MRFANSMLVLSIIVLGMASAWTLYDRDVSVLDLIDYFHLFFVEAAEQAGEAAEEVTDIVIHTLIHQEATPLMNIGSLLSITESKCFLVCGEYNGYYLDTISVHLPNRGLFGWDWIKLDGRYSMWSYVSGSIPVAVDFSRVDEEDVEIHFKGLEAFVTINLPMPCVQPCRIDYSRANVSILEVEHLSNLERASLTFNLYHGLLQAASEQLMFEAADSGVIELAMQNLSLELTDLVTAIYPNVNVIVVFRDEKFETEGNLLRRAEGHIESEGHVKPVIT